MLSSKLNTQAASDQLQRLMPAITCHTLTPLNKGLSNDNFLVESSMGRLLLKSYKEHFPLGALKSQQQLARCQDITANVHAWDETLGIAVFDFLPGTDSPVMLTDSLLSTVLTVHQFEPSHTFSYASERLDILPLLKQLDKHIIREMEEAWAWSVAVLERLPKTLAFFHNDLVKENLIVGKQGSKIIDFEYAAYNDTFFDLAALCCSFELTRAHRSNLLERYFALKKQLLPKYADNKLAAYQLGYLLLSIQWYEHRGHAELAIPLRHQLEQWQV
ncbi:hypothetical protein PA25_05630 [Pseudoalteromonas sp. A25]|uniref:phosphotransferase n=1 Tax=Pseudoalteromonas sp. A25 TaxID=116092 RepID=UPI001260FF1A|nr:phosphotransferase [Pseudoalteromonas sp. A25]BBN80578.1 hypothetical protein PA25_05630 [Pseudoalteromonas sp. A25]